MNGVYCIVFDWSICKIFLSFCMMKINMGNFEFIFFYFFQKVFLIMFFTWKKSWSFGVSLRSDEIHETIISVILIFFLQRLTLLWIFFIPNLRVETFMFYFSTFFIELIRLKFCIIKMLFNKGSFYILILWIFLFFILDLTAILMKISFLIA